jgi:hypothetical protein
MLRSNGVQAFEGYGLKLVIAPAEPATPDFTEERKDPAARRMSDLYSDISLWGPNGAPSFE